MKSIKEKKDWQGVKVLVRLGMNVPIKDGQIEDDFRLQATLPTVEYLRAEGAKVIIIGHIWGDDEISLRVVADWYKRKFPVTFIADWLHDDNLTKTKEQIEAMQAGEVVMLENLRLHEGEKKNDPEFVELLAGLAEVYVNDAFPVCHRDHASITGLPQKLSAFAGLRLVEEVENLSHAFSPAHPFVFIIGGAKFESKVPLALAFLNKADTVFVAGAIMNQFFKEAGQPTGVSLVDKDTEYGLKEVLEHKSLLLPTDAVMVHTYDDVAVKKSVTAVEPTDNMLDIGDDSLKALLAKVADAKTVIWNGPLGDYERGFKEMTQVLAQSLAESTAKVIIGGGDTLAVVDDLGIHDKFASAPNFISTGGGAMLDFLKDGKLVGIEALK